MEGLQLDLKLTQGLLEHVIGQAKQYHDPHGAS
jgi:hypothetical protein